MTTTPDTAVPERDRRGRLPWRRHAVDALRLRALALRVFTDPGAIAHQEWREAIDLPPESWELFLTAERCAITLKSLIASAGGLERLPTAVERVLHRRAREESARVLSARAQLRALEEFAGQMDIRPIVLKGGCSIFADHPLDLVDIDLLLPSDQARSLAGALDARGHEATFSNPQHLRARLMPQALPIEIHLTLEPSGAPPEERLWRGITPLPSRPGLWQLSPVEHLWHVLRHATVDHPSRRGRLRDLLLIADGASACSQSELTEVMTRVDQHEYRSPLRDVLTMALEISRDRPPTDRFLPVAMTHYTIRAVTQRLRLSQVRSRDLAEWTFALVLGPRERRALWRLRVLQTTQEPSPYRFIAAVEERFPRVGRAWRVSVRSAYRTGVMMTALPIAGMARYLTYRTQAGIRQRAPAGGPAQREDMMP